MHLVETHAHLDDPKFDGDRDEVLARAVKAQVAQVLTVGTDLSSSTTSIALADRYPQVYATVGVHPQQATQVDPATLSQLQDLAQHPQVVAIGEIGLGYYYDWAPARDVQRAAFEAQLALADRLGKPVVIHIRDKKGERQAYEDALTLLCDWVTRRADSPAACPPGVLHCFSGPLDIAQEALALGFYIGVDGPVTYPNAKALQTLISELSLERLLLETDCPYLAPQVRRGRRNEPAYLAYIAQKVAELHGVDVQTVTRITTQSAQRLFGLPKG